MLIIYIGSDNVLRLDALKIEGTGAYINNATVTYRLTDLEDVIVTSGTLTYVVASNGRYEGTLDSSITIDLEDFENYRVYVTVTSGISTLLLRATPMARYNV